jgi:hypothetical protein
MKNIITLYLYFYTQNAAFNDASQIIGRINT